MIAPPNTAAPQIHGGLDELTALYRRVACVVEASARRDLGLANPKGDAVKHFDLAADRAVIEHVTASGLSVLIESEESGLRRLGDDAPEVRLVVDPVDGSDNWARGLPLSAFCCALLPVAAPLVPDRVTAALVGPLPCSAPFVAEAGRGAWCEGEPLTTSGVVRLAEALILLELNHFGGVPSFERVSAEARGVRCYGCASRALALVASGAADAYIDVRKRLTAESYLAGAALVIGAGGTVVGLNGGPLQAVRSLTERVGLIAAASAQLAAELAERLGADHA